MKPSAKILIVEDNPGLLFSMAVQLREAGHEVHETALGEDCLLQAAKLFPDLVISDVVLPDIDGVTLCRQIKADPRTSRTFVLLVSSLRTGTDDQAEGIECGADGYLGRPVSEREFLARVEGLLRLKRTEDELRSIQADLEKQVADRTAHLSHSLTALHLEIAARHQAEEQQKKLEAALRQARTMDALGNLAAGTALDFNNILTGILGWTDLARTELPPNSPVAPKLGAIADLCERARSLTTRLLSFSRPDIPRRKPVRLQRLLEGELKVIRATIPPAIEIRSFIDGQAPLVSADPTQIHQLLLSLATNASDAMAGEGILTLRLDATDLPSGNAPTPTGFRPGRYVRLTVTDTGCGMTPDVRERIFEPFFTTRSGQQASGLGLSMVHGIVRNHEGLILVDSDPGRGATFQVLLPAGDDQTEEAESTETAPDSPPTPPRRHRILLLDDQQILVTICTEALQRSGYATLGYAQPAEALAALQADPAAADLVVTDLSMPGMNGLEFARRIHHFRPELPIILITGDPTAIRPEQLAAAGIQRILLKPFTPAELAQAVAGSLPQRPRVP